MFTVLLLKKPQKAIDNNSFFSFCQKETDLLRSTGLPKGPCQLWCSVYSTGQGYFQLGGSIGKTPNGAAIYEVKVDGVSSVAHENTSSGKYLFCTG